MNKTDTSARVFVIVFSVCLIMIMPALNFRSIFPKDGWVKTNGTVEKKSGYSGAEYGRLSVVQYQDRSGSSHLYNPNGFTLGEPSVGEKVEVYYDPNKPSDSVVMLTKAQLFTTLTVSAIGLIVLITQFIPKYYAYFRK